MAGAVGAAAALMLAGIVPAAAADDNAIVMPDDALRACVNAAIDDNRDAGAVITEAEAAALSGSLNCDEQEIADLTGMRHFTSLTGLEFRRNRIEDLSPLMGLDSLTSLSVSTNQVVDLGPLSSLDSLTFLGVANNKITDLTPLAPLTNLTHLYVTRNNLTDLSGIENLTKITHLGIAALDIDNISALGQMKDLQHLELGSNIPSRVHDLTPLQNLEHLQTAYIYNTEVSDVTALTRLESPRTLHLHGNRITNIRPLAGLEPETLQLHDQEHDLGELVAGVAEPNPVIGLDGKPVELDGPLYNEDDNTFTPQPGTSEITWSDENIPGDGTFSGTLTFSLADLEDVEVTTTADAKYNLRYEWDVDLTGDDVVVPAGQDVVDVDYEATVTPTLTIEDFRVEGTITVTNPNGIDVEGVTITSALADQLPAPAAVDALNAEDATCEVTDGVDITVPADESVELFYQCQLPDDTATDATFIQTATATWDADDAPGTTGSATGSTSVDFGEFEPLFADGQYRYLLDPEDVSDPDGHHVMFDAEDGPQTFAFTQEHDVPEPGQCEDRTATFGIGDDGVIFESAEATGQVCAEAPLQVSKNPTATFDRQYLWDIEKSVSTDGVVDERNEARFDYVVQVEQDGYVDSNWAIEGEIEVTNPNTFGQITFDLAQVTDLEEAQCAVDGQDTGVVLAGGETVAMAYECTLGAAPEYETTSTATVTWVDPAGELASASGSAEANFEVAGEIDEVVEVWDDHTDPANPILLGEADRTDEESWVFPYTLILQGEVGQTTQFTNTAWIEVAGENPTASTTVEIVIDPAAAPEARPTMPAAGAPLAGAAALAGLLTLGGLGLLRARSRAKV